MKNFLRAFAIFLIAVLATACSHRERPSDVVSVDFSGRACAYCLDAITIRRDGTLAIPGSRTATVRDVATSSTILDRLPVDELRRAVGAHVAIAGDADVGVRVIYADGSHDDAVIPIGNVASADIAHVQLWVERSSFDATSALEGPRLRAMTNAIVNRTMRSARLEMPGCPGNCPRYSVSFSSDGTATLHDHDPRCDVVSSARVPFELIIDAASNSMAQQMQPVYPVQGNDTLGARIWIETPDGTFSSDAPDRTTWGSTFLAFQSRLDQIVKMVDWKPHVDVDACAK